MDIAKRNSLKYKTSLLIHKFIYLIGTYILKSSLFVCKIIDMDERDEGEDLAASANNKK